jgi:PAS domain S-box-containing protein
MLKPQHLQVRRYGISMMAVALVLGIRLLVQPVSNLHQPFLLLCLGAVLVSAWYGGTEAGLAAIALTVLTVVSSVGAAFGEGNGGLFLLQLLAFLLEGGVICWLIRQLQTTQQTVLAGTQKQQELRRRFQATFEQAAIGLAHVDLQGRWLRVNQKLCEIVGYTPEELLQRTFQDITYADDLATDLNYVEQILAGKITTYTLEKRYVCKDGSLVWINLTVSLVRDAAGAPQYFIAGVEDISDRKQIEVERIELLAREQQARTDAEVQRSRLQTLLQEAPILVAIQCGPDHVYEFANPLYRQVLGDRPLLGKPVRQALPELEEQGFFEILDRVFATGETFVGNEFPAQLVGADGEVEERFFNFVYQPLLDFAGKVEGIITFAFEVTEQVQSRRRVEGLAADLQYQRQALQVSEERYRSLVEATTQIIWNTNAEGNFVTPQPQWSAFTGQATEELWGWGWLEVVHPQDQASTSAAWVAAVATHQLYQVEHRLRRCDGEYRYMSVRAVPVLEEDGSIREWIGVHNDITDRKQAEAENAQLLQREQTARTEAEAANRMKDEFLATLSHELRTPLNAILGWTQLLQKGQLPAPTRKRALETVERNARIQAQLVEDILDVSRIITGNLRLQMQPVNLKIVIEAAVDAVQLAAQAKDIAVALKFQDTTELISGDANRLQQVVWNLLSNAIKFTPKGGQVQVSLTRLGSDAQIQVQDTGQGIHPDFLPHIFERFRQADGSTTRAQGGLGLGLAIVRHLVELHGGHIQAHSPGKGRGATFTISLPVRTIGDIAIAPGPLYPSATAPQVSLQPSKRILEKLRILVVDDEADARELVARVLTDQGALVTTTASAQEAFMIVADAGSHPDVLISDIGMPGEDGYGLLCRVRQLPPEAGGTVPAIALTAYAREEERSQALGAGFQIHLAKPVLPQILVAAVAQLLGRTIPE